MSKGRFQKGNLHRDDIVRALVTDTLPGEVPIIFSNDGFYNNYKNLATKSPDTIQFLEKFVFKSDTRFTIPYRYRISKDSISTRRLSLIHPSVQIEVTKFYGKYEELICSYNSISEFSIRCPSKVGSTYFYRSTEADKNKYKNQSIDTLQFEQRVRNPASYFAYKGYDRLYKFFESDQFSKLEKKYRTMWFGDISKCFDSIYTHSITWALKDMPFAKKSIGKHSFGDAFDRLMQRMNYNETNGICIGPEISRIFAEIILQKVDQQVLLHASKTGLKNRVDFECVRYVDDVIIFARDTNIATTIYKHLESALLEFNLHLNQLKLQRYERPFHTEKSQVILNLKANLENLENQILENVISNGFKYPSPVHIYKPRSLKKAFIKKVKASCHGVGGGYDMVSNYLISSLSNKLEQLVDGYTKIDEQERSGIEKYFSTNLLLLDIMFYFYTLHPTVSTSFKLSKAIVLAIQFVKKYIPDHEMFLSEQLRVWTLDLVQSIELAPENLRTEKIPIELVNVVLALSESDNGEQLSIDFLSNTIFDAENIEYFSTISLLYFIRDKEEYKFLKKKIEKLLHLKYTGSSDLTTNSHDAHLFLDIMACPYLSEKFRCDLLNSALKNFNLKALSKKKCMVVINDLQSDCWFTNWSSIELLNMIKRKELSQVY